jgi:hypothetical protein
MHKAFLLDNRLQLFLTGTNLPEKPREERATLEIFIRSKTLRKPTDLSLFKQRCYRLCRRYLQFRDRLNPVKVTGPPSTPHLE